MSSSPNSVSDLELAEAEPPEVDVNQLMSQIREAVLQREAVDTISPNLGDDRLTAERRFHPAVAIVPPLSLDSGFRLSESDTYHVNDLLQAHGGEFVRNAYRAILKRDPDEAGYHSWLKILEDGRLNKLDVLGILRFSAEGKSKGVEITGLKVPYFVRRAERLPLLGYFIRLAITLVRLPSFVRHHRQLETYLVLQQQHIVDHLNTQIADFINGQTSDYDGQLTEIDRQLSVLGREVPKVKSSLHARLAQAEAHSLKQQEQLEKNLSLRAATREEQFMADQRVFKSDVLARVAALDERAGQTDLLLKERFEQFSKKLQQVRTELLFQEKRTALLLEEARKRLPHALDARQLQSFSDEKAHLGDVLYASLEDLFRGSREEIKGRLRFYCDILKEARVTGEVLDLGCGRGEWMEILQEEGLSARGVEINRVFFEQCRDRGFEVTNGDAVEYLRGLPDESLQAITGFHILEHLPFETLVNLVDESVRVLKPGGVFIMETPNPENIMVSCYIFHFDPSHRKPLPSPMMEFLLESRGLCRLQVVKLHAPEATPVKDDGAGIANFFNYHFHGPMDYAIIGRKM